MCINCADMAYCAYRRGRYCLFLAKGRFRNLVWRISRDKVPRFSFLSRVVRNRLPTKLYNVMKNKKNEELQSRREFFKSAAKATLPVVGAVVLNALPIKVQAAEMGCNNTCYRGCASYCTGYCTTTCNASCYHSHARRGSMVETIEQ